MKTIRKYGILMTTTALFALNTGVVQAADSQPVNPQVNQQVLQELNALKARMQELEGRLQTNTDNTDAVKAEADQAKKAAEDVAAQSAKSSVVLDKLSRGQLQIGRTNVFFNGWIEASMNRRLHNELAGPSNTSVLPPFPVQAQYHDNEFRAGAPQTRFGMNTVSDAADDIVVKTKVEFDMLSGSNASGTANGSSYTPRLRHAWAEIDEIKNGWHIVGGQAYSLTIPSANATNADGSDSANLGWMLLPGTEITPTPDDGEVLGFGSTRNLQFRVVKEVASNAALAISIENNTVNWGGDKGTSLGSAGLPSAVPVPITSNASYTTGITPYVSLGTMPDIVAKVGYDPTPDYHFEAWGILRQYKDNAGIANGLPDTGSVYTGGGALGTYIKLVKDGKASKLDLHLGVGYGSFESQIDGAIPDVTYSATGKPVPIREKYLFGELIGHPTRDLDLFLQSGVEQGNKAGVSGNSTATAFGYGNPFGSGGVLGNQACMSESTSSLTASCRQDTHTVWNVAFTPIWRILNSNRYGHLDFMPEVQYVQRTVFKDQFGYGPHASNWAFDVAFRYWPF